LILESAARTGATLPLTQLHDFLLADLKRRGLGDLDNSAIIRAYDPPDVGG
jgi:3-hydroxyisobutyrate dehydrogenase-like beta-hydroxyacid dehydrogenase